MTEERIGTRIEILINHYKLTKNSFSKEIGLSANTVITRIVNDPTRAPSYAVIKMIADRFPELNMRWLITGQGPMTREGEALKGYIKYFNLASSADMRKAIQGEIAPTSVIHVYGFQDCDFAFDVIGDSMSPRLNPGEVVRFSVSLYS